MSSKETNEEVSREGDNSSNRENISSIENCSLRSVFPRVVPVIVENIVGAQRPMATPPKTVCMKSRNTNNNRDRDNSTSTSNRDTNSTSNINNINSTNNSMSFASVCCALPSWFRAHSMNHSEYGDMFLRNIIVEYYQSKKRRIGIEETYERIIREIDNNNRDISNNNRDISNNRDVPDHLLSLNDSDLFSLFWISFNSCEDNLLINYGTDISQALGRIEKEKEEGESEIVPECIRQTEHTYYINKYTDPRIIRESKCNIHTRRNGDLSNNNRGDLSCDNHASFFTGDFFFACDSCVLSFPSVRFYSITPDLLSGMWSKREEYYLLKAIEEHGDSWEKVEESVNSSIKNSGDASNNAVTNNNTGNINNNTGNNKSTLVYKSKELCIFHFINMCILESITEYHTLPFSKFPNQITSLIAFMGSVDTALSSKISTHFLRIMKNKNTQEDVTRELIHKGVEECKERKRINMMKIERLYKVRIEAWSKKIEMKMESIREIEKEGERVKEELTEKRQNLLEELIRLG